MKRLPMKSIMLVVISLSCLSSQIGSAETLNFNLKLPQEYILTLNQAGVYKPEQKLSDNQLVAFRSQGFNNLLVIYATYKASSKKIPLLMEKLSLKDKKERLLQTKIDSLEADLENLKDGLGTCEANRKLLIDMYDETAKLYKSELKKKKIKTILISLGAGAGGLAIGIIIGFIAAK